MIHHLKKITLLTWIKISIGIFIAVVLFFLIPYGAIIQWISFDHIVDWVQSAQSNTWTLFIFFSAFTFAVLGFPITIFPIIGGVLFDFRIAFPVNLAAGTLGSCLSFAIARYFGRSFVEKFLRGRLKSFDKFTADQGLKTVAIIRLIGVPPFIIANYAMGLSGIKLRDYVIGTVIGTIPWVALMTYLANSFWQAALVGGEKGLLEAVMSKLGPMMALSAVILIGVIVAYFVKRKKIVEPYSNL